MNTYDIFKDLAIIIVAAKLMGILAKKLNIPQVVGEIVAGLLIGPSLLGFVNQTDFLIKIAEIGVILLMFSAGLGTNLKNLVKTGPLACLIAVAGVFVPLIFGTLLYMCFYGFSAIGTAHFYKAVFIGTILTATSVSITVKTLEELGKLKTELGTAIVSAAIIDDVIGIIVLTIVVGMGSGSADAQIGDVIIRSVMFFILAGGIGVVLYKIFKMLDAKYEHQQRIAILGLAMCFSLSYIAEKYFGVADITGAFLAGVILCNIDDAPYIDRKITINSYMLFGPVFFAGIGLKTDLSQLSSEIIIFAICFVLVGIIAKIIGCGLVSKLSGKSISDSLKVGVGMMTRGEVALVVAQKGLAVGLLESVYFTPVILLIVTTSIVSPILLKLIYKYDRSKLPLDQLS